jgi:23S rRNA pseudouridine1911/1915/1917 synthase
MKQHDSATLDIIFEDNHLLAISKPPSLLSQKDQSGKESLEDLARAYLKEKYKKPGNVFLHPIGRLDRCASGIMLFAKTSKALMRLNEAQRKGEIKKYYLAICHGKVTSGHLVHYLAHSEGHASIQDTPFEGAKRAELTFSLLEEKEGLSLVKIHLLTGRYHQIRAQFSFILHPILGDTKYGSRHILKEGAIALNATLLCLVHPVTKLPLSFFSPPPRFWPMTINSPSCILKD